MLIPIPIETMQSEYNLFFKAKRYPEFTTPPHSVPSLSIFKAEYPWGLIAELNIAMDKYIAKKKIKIRPFNQSNK